MAHVRTTKSEKEDPNAAAANGPGSEAATSQETIDKIAELQSAGELKKAFDLCREVFKSDPENTDAHNLGGVIAFQGGNKKMAVKLLQRAVALSPNHAGALNNLGIVLKEIGQLDDAVGAFERSLALNEEDADTHYNLGNALHMARNHDRAADAYARAVSLRPDFADAAYNQGMMLTRLDRNADAAKAFRQVIALRPDFQVAHYELSMALVKSDQMSEAKAAFENMLQVEGPLLESFFRRCIATLHSRGAQALIEICDEMLDTSPADPVALSSKAIALFQTGEADTAHEIADFDRFVFPVRLSAPDGYEDIAAFNAALIDHVRNHPSLEYEPQTQATRYGSHTGNLNQEPRGPVAQFEEMIVKAAEEYVAQLSPNPKHPFVENVPARSHQIIWSIIMRAQGHQVPHIHPQAWLSGVYYAKLPSIMATANADKAGWIEFGEPPPDFLCKTAPEVELFKPEEGTLFLFPSYFYHRTIPFDSDEERVSVAFDFIAET